MDHKMLFEIADRARGRGKLTIGDVAFVRNTAPKALAGFPNIEPPKTIAHPSGFKVSGAPAGTFLRSALMLAGQKALGRRFGGHAFYEQVESDYAMRIMRSNFDGGAPKGAYCCSQCTLATLPVLEARAIRWFDCAELAGNVRDMIQRKSWRFETAPNARMLRWALEGP
jgi:hypothetical protein